MNTSAPGLRGLLLVLGGVLLSCSSSGSEQTGKAEETQTSKEYCPLAVGTTWHYTISESKGVPLPKGKSQVYRVARHEKVGNDMRALIECLQDGNVVSTEQVGLKDDGLYRFALGENKFDPPHCLLKLPVKNGESWTYKLPLRDNPIPVKCTVSEEKVKVPAGEFDAVVVEGKAENDKGPAMSWRYWYVKGMGKVKMSERVLGTPFGPILIVCELEKFEKGK